MSKQEKDVKFFSIYNKLSAMYVTFSTDMALFYQALCLLLNGHIEPYLVLNQGVIETLNSVAIQAKESYILQSLIDDVLVTLWLILDRCAVAGIIL